jgi:hypothetical protein
MQGCGISATLLSKYSLFTVLRLINCQIFR